MLKSVLQYHVLSGNLFSSEMRNDLMPTTLNMNMKVRVNVYNKVSMYHYWYSLNMHLFALLTPFKICIHWNLYICCCSTKYISWYIHWIYSHITICSRRHVCTPFINAMDPGINLFVKEIHSPVRESNTVENYHRMHNNKRHGNKITWHISLVRSHLCPLEWNPWYSTTCMLLTNACFLFLKIGI